MTIKLIFYLWVSHMTAYFLRIEIIGAYIIITRYIFTVIFTCRQDTGWKGITARIFTCPLYHTPQTPKTVSIRLFFIVFSSSYCSLKIRHMYHIFLCVQPKYLSCLEPHPDLYHRRIRIHIRSEAEVGTPQ